MNKYTVLLNFEDRTMGIGQFFTKDPEESLVLFVKESESLMSYNRENILKKLDTIEKKLIKLNGDTNGVWLMNFGTAFLESNELSSIYGGYIILSK